ncbi:GumC family protein [Plebeiibacterium sediminum]|uniref:non-specific protein-tyrosine kinase n=1 Tax=Plebeiibacterium sediminum TaxID=2992112 RepID=A0AAE3M4B8_9BACT|nr:tyrosine-protein kinase [Plebeiobacterium sediminum]MCW3786639.1 polysaccharide biosynthesis tyrosine autokinase [Plebeiobacterium sediminum]
MQNIDEIIEYMNNEQTIDIKSFLFRVLSKWYWFVIFGFIGLCLGFLFAKRKTATYNMNATVLIKDKDTGMSMDKIFDGLDVGGKTSVENHIFMLQSYSLNQQAVKSLNMDISWYYKGIFNDPELYASSPYIVDVNKNSKNLKGIKLFILPKSPKSFLLKMQGVYIENGVKYNLDSIEKGEYGVPFESNLFNFTITKNKNFNIQQNKEYYFKINDLNYLTNLFKSRLSVSQVNKKTNGIILSLTETVPQRGVDYLNALIDVYLKYDLESKNRTSENTIRFIDNQIQTVVDSLTITGNLFTEFRSKKGIVNLSQEASQVADRLKVLQTEKELAQRKMDYFKNLQTYMNDADQMKNIAVPSVLGIADAGLNALVVKLGELYNKKSTMSFVVKEENPAIKILNNEIDNCLNSLGENIKNLLQNTSIELRNINSQMNGVQVKLASLPKTEQQLINIKRTFDINNELYTFLLQKRAEAAITSASNIPDATVMDPARLETVIHTGLNNKIYLIIGLLLGFSIPLIIIFLYDFLDDTIKSYDELEKISKLPIIAEIPKSKYSMEIPIVKYPRSSIAENFRNLRMNLQYLSNSKDSKVIAIHSSIPGEGKTFTCLNLASVLAMDNKNVLLIGCDLRKPRLHKIFNSNNDIGVSSYLIGKHNYNEIIKATEQENLYYINAGPIPINPAELIGNGKFKDLIDQARKDFHYVVLDNAPLSFVVDGFLIGKYADINITVVRHGYSHKKQTSFINQLKDKDNFNNPAIILNGTSDKRYNTGYGKYGNYKEEYYDDIEEKVNFWKKLFRRSA